MRQATPHSNVKPSARLFAHQNLVLGHRCGRPVPVPDLACGRGRNGIFLAGKGCQVVFADRDGDALQDASRQLESAGQAQTGRPANPDHLLQPGELRGAFGDWQR